MDFAICASRIAAPARDVRFTDSALRLLEALEQVGTLAYKAGMDVVAYISMAFGNPYGEAWDIEEVVAACDLLAGVKQGARNVELLEFTGTQIPD